MELNIATPPKTDEVENWLPLLSIRMEPGTRNGSCGPS